MEHSIHRVKAFEVTEPYRLRIEFADGVVRTIDYGSSDKSVGEHPRYRVTRTRPHRLMAMG